jgi:alpha-N-arabinofuranosidase
MQLQPETCSGLGNPSFIGFRQAHLMGYAATQMEFNTDKENEKAGLLVFQNEKHHYFLCKSSFNNKPVVQLYKNDTLLSSIEMPTNKPIQLKIESKGKFYAFYYATENNNWQLVKDNLDATFLSTEVAGGFVGCFYTLYATSNGMVTNNKVSYNWFENKNNDTVYNK